MLEYVHEVVSYKREHDEELSDSLFGATISSLEKAVNRRGQLIAERHEIYALNVREIEDELSEKEHRLTLLSGADTSQRLNLEQERSSLLHERRQERVRALKDVAAFEKEKQETVEELVGISQLFNTAAITKDKRGDLS